MQAALRIQTTVLPGKRIEVTAPELCEGARVEVIVVLPEPPNALQPSRQDPWAVMNSLRDELARSGREFPDSTPLIREDRDR
jgi:hypothetical protein